MEEIFERVKEVIGEQLGIEDIETITMETTFIEDLGADSLDMVEMLMNLEDEFGVSIPDEEAGNIKTVKNLVDFVEKNK